MKDLKQHDMATLMEMLSQYTNKFMTLFREGASQKEYIDCKKMMSELTKEIESRRQGKTSRQIKPS